MFDREVRAAAEKLFTLLRSRQLTLATAESCTGGLLAAAITEIPGSSEVLERGFVTYSNAAKIADLGVAPEIIESRGAVSAETARGMALGTLRNSHAEIAVSVTGIAGPGGGTREKPIGLVHFAAARRNGPSLHREMRFGDLGRGEIRRRSVLAAIDLVTELVNAPA
jgi:nicotinamide-nucleotide amidase